MDFLTNTVDVFRWEKDGWWREYEHHEVDMDEDGWYAILDNHYVEKHRERPAKWWAVAMYETTEAYGGPEEGGWWYTVGELIEHGKIRYFDNLEEAEKYRDELWDLADEWNKCARKEGDLETRYIVQCYTERMVETHFPKKRPYYS